MTRTCRLFAAGAAATARDETSSAPPTRSSAATGCSSIPAPRCGRARPLVLALEAPWPSAWGALYESFERQGVAVRVLDASPAAAPRANIRAEIHADFLAECAAAMRWAGEQRAAGVGRIGVVICGLDADRSHVEQLADRWLNPECLVPGGDARPRRYNLSGGWPIRRHAMVDAALLLLRLGSATLTPDEAGSLLRSRYWLPAAARADAARVDLELRELGLSRVTPRRLATIGARIAPGSPLASVLADLAEEPLPPRARPASEWAEGIAGWLQARGWPGDRGLSSREYQALERWQELLAEFGGFDRFLDALAPEEAAERLRRLAEARLFQPQSPAGVVELLSWDEAWGQDFDALRVVGLDDGRFVPARHPDPILPIVLQRKAGVPAADPGRMLAQARARLAALCRTPEVVLSCARRDEDRDLQPAALAREFVDWPAEVCEPPSDPLVAAMRREIARESVPDARAPGWPGGETRGGSRLLGDQAACPFRAFARHRLSVNALPESAAGIPPRLRGNLVHAALHGLWRQLGGHAGLLAQSEETVSGWLRTQLQAAIAECRREAPEISDATWDMELERNTRLIGQLLAAERERPPFEVVGREDAQELQLSTLQLKLRPDRLDRVGGQRVVVDYKTGRQLPSPWAQQRPEEPQLMIYALADPAVRAAAFAQIYPGAVGFAGISADESPAEGVKPLSAVRALSEQDLGDWDRLRAHWRDCLTELAREFEAGTAAVLPQRGAQTCRHCDLGPLCRIGQRDAEADEDAA